MLNALSSALSALNVNQKRLNQSAHNIANASTPAFVPSRVDLADVAGGGVQATATPPMASGGVQFTGHSLDLAINGGGYFSFSDPQSGQVYSRAGNLRINSNGQLTDTTGRLLQPPVTLPANTAQVTISPQGQVSAFDNQGNLLNEQQIELASFANTGGLSPVGDNNYMATQSSGPAMFNPGNIISGALQTSGTNLAHEMVDQIVTQRAFEANIRTIQTADEMLGSILDIKT